MAPTAYIQPAGTVSRRVRVFPRAPGPPGPRTRKPAADRPVELRAGFRTGCEPLVGAHAGPHWPPPRPVETHPGDGRSTSDCGRSQRGCTRWTAALSSRVGRPAIQRHGSSFSSDFFLHPPATVCYPRKMLRTNITLPILVVFGLVMTGTPASSLQCGCDNGAAQGVDGGTGCSPALFTWLLTLATDGGCKNGPPLSACVVPDDPCGFQVSVQWTAWPCDAPLPFAAWITSGPSIRIIEEGEADNSNGAQNINLSVDCGGLSKTVSYSVGSITKYFILTCGACASGS